MPFDGPDAYVPSLNYSEHPTDMKSRPIQDRHRDLLRSTVPHVVRRSFTTHPAASRPTSCSISPTTAGSKIPGNKNPPCREHLPGRGKPRPAHPRCQYRRVGDRRWQRSRLEKLRTLQEGVVSGILPLDDRDSLYASWGDWFGLSCLAITIGLGPVGLVRVKIERRRGIGDI